jgi:hypothetical protein
MRHRNPDRCISWWVRFEEELVRRAGEHLPHGDLAHLKQFRLAGKLAAAVNAQQQDLLIIFGAEASGRVGVGIQDGGEHEGVLWDAARVGFPLVVGRDQCLVEVKVVDAADALGAGEQLIAQQRGLQQGPVAQGGHRVLPR